MTRLPIYSASLLCLLFLFSCNKKNINKPDPVTETLYFPAVGSDDWQTTSPASLGWNETEISNLYSYLESKDTKAFIIVKSGKIVAEKYFGTFTADSIWYWASAGKTMTAFLIGIAQQEGLLNIYNRNSQYLGTGWTSEPLGKENLITSKKSIDHDNGPG